MNGETFEDVAKNLGLDLENAAPFYFVLRSFVSQLKKARLEQRLTLQNVSDRSGIAVETLSRLETGAVTNPTWQTLGMYAKSINRKPVLTMGVA